ncbi:hypothetical protein ACIQMY_20190 [Streptomyces sp. NPDC091368]|uniref:hypothetical protein n=1 Tax=Streptomyces sp. NPDC091368 TaxID=3365993 RepID=UPI0038124E46
MSGLLGPPPPTRPYSEATNEGVDGNSKKTVQQYLRRRHQAQAGIKRSTRAS